MRYKDWSISLKLIVIMVVLGVIASGSVGLIGGIIAKRTIDASMQDHYSSIRDMRVEQMQNWYGDRNTDLQMVVQRARIAQIFNLGYQIHQDYNVQPGDNYPVDAPEYKGVEDLGIEFENWIKLRGYRDMMIMCAAHGHVMWSLAENSDMGGNCGLGSGKLTETILNDVWKGVKEANAMYVTGIQEYEPAGGIPCQFIGAPIMVDGQMKAVLALSLPIQQIDTIMQSSAGMGQTGETYLVGGDKTLRSNSRLSNDETMCKLKADTAQVVKALEGQTGFMQSDNYDGKPVLAAYAPIEVLNRNWAVISEVTRAEAYAPITVMLGWIIGTVLVMSVIIALMALFTGRSIGNPLARLAKSCRIMAEGNFTEVLEETTARDEIGQMLAGFKEMQSNTAGLIRQVTDAATNVASSSEELSAGADETGKAIQEVARTVDEVAKGSAETNKNVESVAAAVTQTTSQGEEGQKFADQTNTIMQRATASIESTATVIGALSEKTAQIEEFIGIITAIADQTNLLALNAAIEAARAGEAGRGFAVVAEEVRKLAEESNSAAGNITQMITGIKAEMADALAAMDSSKNEVAEGATMVMQTSDMLSEIVTGVGRLSEQVDAIAAIATQNSAAAEEVASTTEEQTASMEEIGASAGTLASLSQELNSMVARFKV